MRKMALSDRKFVWREQPKPAGAWFAGDPIRSTIFNVMSLGIGAHEARLMRTFNKVLTDIRQPELSTDVQLLIRQESQHYRAHDPLNLGLTSSDDKTREFFNQLRARHLTLSEQNSFEAMLTYLLMTENCFGCMGRVILSEKKYFDGADPDIAALWIYHSLEELEHTRVSFDVVYACLGPDGVPSLLRNAAKRLTGYADGDVTRDRDLQDKMTDKMRWLWLSDMVEALACPSMRGAGIRDLYDDFMGGRSVIFSAAGGWYDFFDPHGWHPSARYDEDARLIEYWDSYLRREGFVT